VKVGVEAFAGVAAALERSLEGKDYLCGRLTIADFANLPYAVLCETAGLSLEPYRNVRRWVGRMLTRDSVQRTLAAAREAS
jgi:glutathione S-transferase